MMWKTMKRPLFHSQPTSQKKESTDIRTEEGKKFRQRNWVSKPRPLVLRTSALTTELSRRSRYVEYSTPLPIDVNFCCSTFICLSSFLKLDLGPGFDVESRKDSSMKVRGLFWKS